MDNPAAEIMTLPEVAAYLRIGEKTVHRMIQRKELPCVKVAGQWRFIRSVIDHWLLGQIRESAPQGLAKMIQADDQPLPLSRMIPAECIAATLECCTRDEILQTFAAWAAHIHVVQEEEFFLTLLREREAMASTAIGGGVAIPHIREPRLLNVDEPRILLGRTAEGIEYDAPDGKPVKLFFLVLSGSLAVHLKMISKLAVTIQDKGFISALERAETKEEIMEEISKIRNF